MNLTMNLTEEQVIELFEEFLDENFHVGELTEENILWIYEEEFLPALEESIEESAEGLSEEPEVSPKMQSYLDKMNTKGTKSIEHGGDGATTKRDVIIARLQSKKNLSMKEADLLARLIAAEEKEDTSKKK